MKTKTEKLFEQCKVTEVIIHDDKYYVVGVEVSHCKNVEAVKTLIEQLVNIFDKKLNVADKCVFIPMYDGAEPIKLREATPEEDINKFE